MLATYEDMAELIRLGAYRQGSDNNIDEAIFYYPQLESFLSQGLSDKSNLEEGYQALYRMFNIESPPETNTDEHSWYLN